MQLLAKFKKILYMGFRATLNFSNFAKSCISSCLSKFCIKKKIHRAIFEILALKAEIKGVLSSS